MRIKRSGPGAAQSPAVVQVEPIGLAQLNFAREVLADLASDWCAELDGICTDEATLVLVPESGDDAIGPSFVVSRECGGYRLHTVHWNATRDLGVFPSLADIMTEVQRRLWVEIDRAYAGSVALH